MCDLLPCNIPCYNDGICDGDTCQCRQENGIAKYRGESCEILGDDACAGNPCQNGGMCTLIVEGEIQACFLKNLKEFSKLNIMFKL